MEIILDAIERAVAVEDRHLLETIGAQVEEFGAACPDHEHGFLIWLELIRRGVSTLPDRIPTALLRAWVDSYSAPDSFQRVPVSSPPLWRCFGCGVSLPHTTPHTWTQDGCPVCGGLDIRRADISKPSWGDGWIASDSLPRSA